MKHLTKKQTFTPIITGIIAITLLFTSIFPLDNLTIIIVAITCIIASFIEYGKEGFKSLGFKKKHLPLKQYLIVAPLIAIGLFAFYAFILLPVATYITGQAIDFSEFDIMRGNLTNCLFLLGYIWISAAFGEEIVFRGYLMQQFEKIFGRGKLALVLNILILGILFGLCHSYQGITGQIVTGVIGMLIAIIFHKTKNDLKFVIIIHGIFDTIAVICMYFGWY